MRKKLAVVAVAVLMCLMLAACFTEFELPPLNVSGGWGYPVPFTGRVEGSGTGYVGTVGVAIDLQNGFIIDVDFDLRAETAMFVRTLSDRLLPMILRTNSFNFPDRTGGASYTNRGVKEAAREALLKIEGVTEADLDF